MLPILKANQEKIQFILGLVLLYGLWHFGYESYLAKHTQFDWKLNRIIGLQVSSWFTIFGGYDTRVISYSIYPHLMYLNALPIISIDTPCNGFPMIYLFCAFILVYPGPWRRKLVFCLSGIFILHTLNLVRIIALSYHSIYSSDYFYFNHKYLFQIIVYGTIFTLWAYWLSFGKDNSIGWLKGITAFVQFKFISRLLKAI